MKDKVKIDHLEKQIAELQEQLRVEKQRKESLWNELYETFLERIYGSDLSEDSEKSCEVLASIVSEKLTEWANRQRGALAQKIARSGVLRMPVYTDCLNDLIFTLSQPGSSNPPSIEPLEVPQADFEMPSWGEDSPLPLTPGLRNNINPEVREEAPMEKLNSFSKRVNVPKPSRSDSTDPYQ